MVFAITILAFTLLYVGGGDIARRMLGDGATEEAIVALNAQLGLDRPLPVQYVSWLGSALRGDLGQSWSQAATVSTLLSTRMTVTISLVLFSILISAILGVTFGVTAALNRGSLLDRTLQTLSLAGAALPGFLIALVLITVFAVQLRWFAPTGFTPPSQSIAGWLSSVTLPVTALVIGGIASSAQQIRGAMINVLQQDYIRTLRSAGLPFRSIVFRHALRNAAGPGLSVLALQFVALLGGSVVIENLFAIPGLGSISVQSTLTGDIPVVMGVVTMIAILVVIVNLSIDIVQGWLNPKARVS